MNFMGMGVPELGVIFLVAFLVLGPSRAIDMARNAGKVLGDLRRSFGDVTSAMNLESMEQRGAAQDQKPDPQKEPLPGVPVRAEIPPEDGEQEGGQAAPDTGSEDGSETGDKG